MTQGSSASTASVTPTVASSAVASIDAMTRLLAFMASKSGWVASLVSRWRMTPSRTFDEEGARDDSHYES